MVQDEVGIFNLALNAIGKRDQLSSTSERDRGAEVCRLWYPVIRDQVLSSAPWPSCKMFKRLAVLARKQPGDWTDADPEPGYAIAYSCPADMLHPRYLANFASFSLSSYQGGVKALNTNVEQATLCYTFRNYAVTRWESELQMAVAYGLAANIVMPLTGKAQRANWLVEQANDLILSARVEAANEGSERFESIPDWLMARGYNNPGDNRYYYPFGTLLSNPGTSK